MASVKHFEHLERSRQELLAGIGEHPDLVLVRGVGNWGDELIWAGTRRLLEGHVYREVGIDEVATARGHTALICGSGAFCQPFHELMPHVLAIAEMRFERVVVLPSSFDTTVDAVREALRRSQALVFAREQESFRRIQSLCDARLAHDCAFFFDYEPFRDDSAASGALSAFRTDREATGERLAPPENEDISLTARSLDDWLRRIGAHQPIRTDRAHVMIAAAMLGKTVEFAPSSYFKVPAIAAYALGEFPVTPLPSVDAGGRQASERVPSQTAGTLYPEGASATRERLRSLALRNPPQTTPMAPGRDPRVTVAILSHERAELALGAIASVLDAGATGVPVRVLVIDNNSSRQTRRRLSEACAENPSIELRLSDRNLGCTGGRALAVELSDSEFVMFLDDDAELMPGALVHLLSELDRHPEAQGVSPTVMLSDGRVSHSGGWYSESHESVCFTLAHSGKALEETELALSGGCDWIPGTAALLRREVFERFPLDLEMTSYSEDVEWCLRVSRARGQSFRRSREALALHHAQPKPWGDTSLSGRASVVGMIEIAAYFYRRHGRLLRIPGVDVFAFVPGLTRTDGTLELGRARLLMELASTHSGDWLLMQWMNGGLDPLLRSDEGNERETLNRLHEMGVQLNDAHAELASARTQLDDAAVRIDLAERERAEASMRLRGIYGSRLWKLGATYDRLRRGTRAARSLGGRR
jgi:GT2 family glycosyltransferase